MCGICGFLSDKAIDDNIIKRMTDSMYHRGPDFQDTCYLEQRLNQYGAFGHCRLSILDLSEKGNQPMWSKDGRYCIVYNGEIYNHLKYMYYFREFLVCRVIFLDLIQMR